MYEVPSQDELKKFMLEKNLTGTDISDLTGVIPRTARYWVASVKQKKPYVIPWAAWALIQILTGEKTKDDILALINEWKTEKIGRGLFERGKVGRPVKETASLLRKPE